MGMSQWASFFIGAIVVFEPLAPRLLAQVPATTAKSRRVTAEEVSRRFLPRYTQSRDEAEKRIITVMEEMYVNQSRGTENVLPEDGRLLRMLTEILGARHAVELGTGNGYSSLWFCLALRSTGGKLTTHEIDPKRIALAKEKFQCAGVENLATLVDGDAYETIERLVGRIDLLLLDAEKEGFTDYLTKLLPQVRIGGLIIAHDSSRRVHMMYDHFQAIGSNADLETVFVGASRWGMFVTRKMW